MKMEAVQVFVYEIVSDQKAKIGEIRRAIEMPNDFSSLHISK